MFMRVVDTPAPADPPRAAREPRGYEILPLDARRHRLRLRGALHRAWAAPLFRGLAAHGLDVVRGRARRLPHGGWRASFEIARRPDGADPMGLDVLALATPRPGATAPPAFVLSSHRLGASSELGGSLRLDVTAPDQHGFLAGLLDRLAFLSLVPEAMEVETGPYGVRDRFHLRTGDGRCPGPAVQRILAEALAGRLLAGTGPPAARAG